MGFRLDNTGDTGATGASFSDGLFQIYSASDGTKKFKFSLSGQATGTTSRILTSGTVSRDYTLPDAAGTFDLQDNIATLTNKSMSGLSNTFTNISLTASVTGVLPVANGGTNSSTALNNNRIMISSGGAIVENGALAASAPMRTTAGGLPTTGSTSLTTEVTGVLPLANGGTNNNLTASNGAIAYSDASKIALSNVGTGGQLLSSGGAGAPSWFTSELNSSGIRNLGIATSVGSSALTISLKQSDGSTDPASGDGAVIVGMRSSTLTSGAFNKRSVTAALSLVISSGSTLGQTNAKPANIYVYLIDNAGTLELAVSGTRYAEMGVISTTAEGGAGAADSGTVVYSTTARSNVPYRLVGVITNTQTTAGTWASAGTVLGVGAYGTLKSTNVPTVQTFTTGSGTYYTPAGVAYLKVKIIGGGQGGQGSGAGAGSGTAGGDSTFGTSLLLAAGGGSASANTVGSASTIINSGVSGRPSETQLVTSTGGQGFSTPFGYGGIAGIGNGGSGGNATTNSGAGGGGAGGTASAAGGKGGSSGGFLEVIIPTPLTSYAYSVGTGGGGGTAGTSGGAGGNGAGGYIVVEEYYY